MAISVRFCPNVTFADAAERLSELIAPLEAAAKRKVNLNVHVLPSAPTGGVEILFQQRRV